MSDYWVTSKNGFLAGGRSGVAILRKIFKTPLTGCAKSLIFKLRSGRKKSKIISPWAFFEEPSGAMGFCRF
jgi:hypothetical protein